MSSPATTAKAAGHKYENSTSENTAQATKIPYAETLISILSAYI
jgi:hypothetical protein